MKIIVIDDDPFFRNFYSTKLKELGYTTEVAIDGEDAMAKIKTFLPDLILLDIIMPKKDGFTVLSELSSDLNLKNIPVIVFSTLGQEADVTKAKSLGARDYINKSYFDFENMKNKINSYLTPT
jgi:CheY-like chemotaxis protein